MDTSKIDKLTYFLCSIGGCLILQVLVLPQRMCVSDYYLNELTKLT